MEMSERLEEAIALRDEIGLELTEVESQLASKPSSKEIPRLKKKRERLQKQYLTLKEEVTSLELYYCFLKGDVVVNELNGFLGVVHSKVELSPGSPPTLYIQRLNTDNSIVPVMAKNLRLIEPA